MLPFFTLLLFRFIQAAQVESGCLLQHNSRVYSGTKIKTIPKSSVEKCAEACTEKFDCNMFSFNDYKACYLYRKGEIHSNSPSTSGFCPKGKTTQTISGVNVKPAYSPLRCSTHSHKVCQFPFILNGVVKWDCVEAGAKDRWVRKAHVCNVKESNDIQKFSNLEEFEECGECSPSLRHGNIYFVGFGLANEGGTNVYSQIKSRPDCQILCDLAEGCNFFVFNPASQKCFLKFGIGEKMITSGIQFGIRTKKGWQNKYVNMFSLIPRWRC